MEAGARRRNGDAGNLSGIVRVEGIYVDFYGEGHQGGGQVKNLRSQSDVPGEEGEEIESPKRKIIRVESEETQDYVREAKDMDQEEAEELSFVVTISAAKKTPSFWQFASVVIKEGEESYMTNVCQQCYNDSLEAKKEINR